MSLCLCGALRRSSALQTAAIEPRVRAVVAVSSFSDLRTIATERAFYFPRWSLGPAFARAEHDAQFVVDDVSPVRAAEQIDIPVLLVHGMDDRDTAPAHSQRLYQTLKGPKRLLLIPGASHNDVLTGRTWSQISSWLASVSPLPK